MHVDPKLPNCPFPPTLLPLFLFFPINYICFSKDLELRNHLRSRWVQLTNQDQVETILELSLKLPS